MTPEPHVLVDGVLRPLLNSRKKPVGTTDASVQAFWRWFGDSKVVDKHGRPLVVYHGTGAHFPAFNRDAAEDNATHPADWGEGFYFALQPEYANLYAEEPPEGGRVLPCYLRILRPAKNRTMVSRAIQHVLDGDEYFDSVEEKLDDLGFDGVWFTHDTKPPRTELVVFSPTQIKSATGNRGTWDPSDPVMTNPVGRLKPAARLPKRLAKALRRGAKVEREHTRESRTARIIASHHLAEDPRYYAKLTRMERNPVIEAHGAEEDDLVSSGLYFGERAAAPGGARTVLKNGYTLHVRKPRDQDPVVWGITFRGRVVGGGSLSFRQALGAYAEEMVGFTEKHRGKGLHRAALAALRIMLGPFYSDDSRTPGNDSSWQKVPGVSFRASEDRYRYNPSDSRYPVMSYAAAHAWEAQAAERGVSAVARSSRGFLRAYERAGSWSRLDPWWRRRREGFIARHMAQANRGERLWENVRGTWRPTRRALALIMWAFMPPGRPAGAVP